MRRYSREDVSVTKSILKDLFSAKPLTLHRSLSLGHDIDEEITAAHKDPDEHLLLQYVPPSLEGRVALVEERDLSGMQFCVAVGGTEVFAASVSQDRGGFLLEGRLFRPLGEVGEDTFSVRSFRSLRGAVRAALEFVYVQYNKDIESLIQKSDRARFTYYQGVDNYLKNVVPLEVLVGKNHLKKLLSWKGDAMREWAYRLRYGLSHSRSCLAPPVRILFDASRYLRSLPRRVSSAGRQACQELDCSYAFSEGGKILGGGVFFPDLVFAFHEGDPAQSLDYAVKRGRVFGAEGCWIPEDKEKDACAKGFVVRDFTGLVLLHLITLDVPSGIPFRELEKGWPANYLV